MGMVLKKAFNYRTKLFFLVNIFFWILVLTFVIVQYSRERKYKVELLDSRLQAYNSILINRYEENGHKLSKGEISQLIPDKDVRVTLIARNGNVEFDSFNAGKLENHKTRPEIADALSKGHGYTTRRLSETDHREYFYSATANGDIVVRSALPYDVTLINVLKGDTVYIWLILGTAVILNIILYFAINRITLGVKSLQEIVKSAEAGGDLDYDMSSFPNDELGEVSRAIVEIYSKLKQTALERDKSMEETLFEEKEKLRIKHQLTSNINHELKTPVQAIRGCFETLLENNLDGETVKKLLETGYSNTMRLNNLLQDVALITRMTEAKNTLDVKPVNVREVVDAIKNEVSQYSPENKMRINIDMPEQVDIEGNRQLIDAIFRNLVNNSIAYSGGRDIFISMNKETDDAYWFDVYDNGTGVEDKHLSRIFERFYRIDSGRSRKSGGTGLGLSIVRNSVQFHGGEIKAQNRQYAGLEFIFSLKKHKNQIK